MATQVPQEPATMSDRAAGPPVRLKATAWGFEVGIHSLRAMQVGLESKTDRVVALAADSVRYPTSTGRQPGGPGPVEAALRVFLQRNAVGDEPIAVGVTDPTSLLVYSDIPPVDDRRLGNLVAYEAKLQIPLALEDVVWDYQRFRGEGTVSEPPSRMDLLCLAALKYERFDLTLLPFDNSGLWVDIFQLSPAALFNVSRFEDPAGVGGDEPVAFLDMGTKASTLTVAHGSKIWRRNIPSGGDVFSEALAERANISLLKAEQMKRNLTRTPNPRSTIESMRGAFDSFAAEVVRAIDQYGTPDKKFPILAIGDGFQLPVLVNFLQNATKHPVERLKRFRRLDCSPIGDHPAFLENLSSFTACYGLGLQALGLAPNTLNLLPQSMRTSRARSTPTLFSWFGRKKNG